jgi:hypothetical protein
MEPSYPPQEVGREFHFFIELTFTLPLLCSSTINFVGLHVVQCPQARVYMKFSKKFSKSVKFTLEKQQFPKISQSLCQNNLQLEVS